MKNIILCFVIFLLASCSKEGDLAKLSGFDAAELKSTSTNVVLQQAEAKNIALQFVWNPSDMVATQSVAQSLVKTRVELSTDKDFTSIAKAYTSVGASLTFTHQQLNRLTIGFGFEPGEIETLYVRLVSVLASNVDPKYSNTLSISVTPYLEQSAADYLYVANKDLTTFTQKLCSRKEDGLYDGFVKMDQWQNFYLTNDASANASKIYGSYPVNGNQYVLYDGDDRWNCWVNNGGYLYLSADVNKKSWSETVISSLSVTGDFNGWSATATPMTYDAANNVWTATITNTAAEQWGVKILINGSWTWFFGTSETAGHTDLYTADASGFAYDKVGTHVLKLDLSDPKAFKYTID